MKSNIILTVLKKELLDMFRDKKTIILGILVPMLMIPLMYGIMGKVMNSEQKSASQDIKLALKDQGNTSLGKFLRNQKGINIVQSDNIQEDVKSGKITLAVEIPSNFEDMLSKNENPTVTATYDNTSQKSDTSWSIVNSYIQQYSQEVVKQRLAQKGIDSSILTPVNIVEKTSAKQSEAMGKLLITMLLPFFLVIYSIMGPIPAATDLGAGEKERGTLEPLLTTQASRIALLWGKFLAITVMGVFTTIAFLTGFGISLLQKDNLFNGVDASSLNIGLSAILIMCLSCLLLTMVFGALELSVSIFAKSFKEASTYSSPIMLLGMIPSFLVYMADVKNINPLYVHIPVANVMVIMKEALSGIYNIQHLVIVFLWCVVYVVLSILFAVYMFSKEEVIFRT